VRFRKATYHLGCETVKQTSTETVVEVMDPEQGQKIEELEKKIDHLEDELTARKLVIQQLEKELKKFEAEITGWEKVDEERIKQLKVADSSVKKITKESADLTKRYNKLVKKHNKLVKSMQAIEE
jgi:chromosome segregation ATPase